ncbi:hypothetical protein [Listeria sp. ILCC797]|uniref:hypothetical protein n=1 Tax=Listeria sp. ILCC797 TaxID=1918333 RepID=UPI000B590991|nr:hypothetical protein [Listeria sp. ILCC797]
MEVKIINEKEAEKARVKSLSQITHEILMQKLEKYAVNMKVNQNVNIFDPEPCSYYETLVFTLTHKNEHSATFHFEGVTIE